MRRLLWCSFAIAALSTLSALADSVTPLEVGEPILPGEALRVALNSAEENSVLRGELAQVAKLHWEVQGDLVEKVFEGLVEIPFFSASLLYAPATRALPGSLPPRDCGDVLRERREVHRELDRVGELRELIEARLDRQARLCKLNDHCRPSSLDGPLSELHGLIERLSEFAARENVALPDRRVVYRFHLDGPEGYAALAEGWRPLGLGIVSRVRFAGGSWEKGDSYVFGGEGGLDAPPLAQGDGSWILTRTLNATHACANRAVFNLEFRAVGRTGTKPNAPPQEIRVKGIAL